MTSQSEILNKLRLGGRVSVDADAVRFFIKTQLSPGAITKTATEIIKRFPFVRIRLCIASGPGGDEPMLIIRGGGAALWREVKSIRRLAIEKLSGDDAYFSIKLEK